MSDSNSTSTSTSMPVTRLDGQVKWFNNRRTYGWITVVSNGEHKGSDVFVHQTNINSSGYRTLTNGEYVSFDLTPSQGENHPFHATNVTGINGGQLLCDVQAEDNKNRPFRPNRRNNNRRQHHQSNRDSTQQTDSVESSN